MMTSSPICFLSKASKTKSWLWHRRLSHLNFCTINHLARHGLVRGLPELNFKKDHLCSACAMGKSKKKPHKPKSKDTNHEKLYLLHMDLCGPMHVASVNGKKYILVIVDDYSWFTWWEWLGAFNSQHFIVDQDRATIAKSSTLPYDSAPHVTSPAAVEGTQEVEIHRLKERVKLLEEREGVAAKSSGDDAPIKGRSMDEGEAATERISDDSEEMVTVLTLMDATTVLASGMIDVPTSSGSIPTASTPAEGSVPTGRKEVPTDSLVFANATVVTPVTRRKGKEVMVESETPKKQKVQEQIDAQVARELEEQLEREDQRRAEQIARDAEIARIHAKEELQIMISGLDRNNEIIAKYRQEYHQFSSKLPMERRIELISDLVKYQDNYTKIYKFQSQQRKLWTKKQKRDYYMAVIRNNLGWKEEAERIKRKVINLEQESAKKQKTSEEVTEEEKPLEEVTEEKVKDMMQLVPIEEVYVESLQVKHSIIGWKVYHEGQRSYWKITRLVKETLSNRPPTSDKEMELWVELSRLYEPDNEDQLWTHTQNFMHATVEWKLYDTYRVHHVTAKDKEIFMLVEKDYPLRKGLALVMICYKFQVENYS
uniref:Putative ribonuclease H-like domain-containing protein n=1 Tax=Tanacetum cinerariifolium TaxID=118510 RepID=A0A699JPR0_TANCI|nr:putative ribonuclease H-like domain-containing protein [Tanacetum cinerariifolium]